MRQFVELAGDVRDPYPMFEGLRADCPVMEVAAPRIGSLFTVLSHDLTSQVLTDPARFSSGGDVNPMGQVLGRSILQMDGAEHVRYRALVAGAFRARVLEGWRSTVIEPTVEELLGAFVSDGHADLVPQLTFPFPVRVIARVLGLPDSDWPRFLRLSTSLISVVRNWDGAVAASRELRDYFAEVVAERRRRPRSDLISQLVQASVDGRGLSDEEIYPFLLLLLPAGAETTYRAASNLLFALLSRPEVLDAVRFRRSLVPVAIEEALRWETPVLSVARTATGDVSLGGVQIPGGGFVAVSLGAANRDPARYPEPDAFDVFRVDKSHVSFGDGPHMCLGMHLARMEMRVLLNAVLDRLPGVRLDPAAEDVHVHGLVFRSPPALPVVFDALRVSG